MDRVIKIKTVVEGEKVLVRALIEHPMDTGRQKDADGNLLEVHYIREVECLVDDQPVFSANWTTSISRNPYISFRCRARAGQTLQLRWLDNLGEQGSKTHTIA